MYLLLELEAVVYVGQSTDVEARIEWHAQQAKLPQRGWRHRRRANRDHKPFDQALWLSVPLHMLDAYEGALIRFFMPRHNRCAPSDASRDEEVLRVLGLLPFQNARHAS